MQDASRGAGKQVSILRSTALESQRGFGGRSGVMRQSLVSCPRGEESILGLCYGGVLTPEGWTCPGNRGLPAVSLSPRVSSWGLSVGPRAGKCPWGRDGQISFSPGCSSPVWSLDPVGCVRHGVCLHSLSATEGEMLGALR